MKMNPAERSEQIRLYGMLDEEAERPSTLPERKDQLAGAMYRIGCKILGSHEVVGQRDRMRALVAEERAKPGLQPPSNGSAR